MFFYFLKFLRCIKNVASLMTPISEAFVKEVPDRKDFWENELKSLGVEPKERMTS